MQYTFAGGLIDFSITFIQIDRLTLGQKSSGIFERFSDGRFDGVISRSLVGRCFQPLDARFMMRQKNSPFVLPDKAS